MTVGSDEDFQAVPPPGTVRLQAPGTAEFWQRHALPRWEQKVLAVLLWPVLFLGTLLSVPFRFLAGSPPAGCLLTLPLQAVWLLCLGIILFLSALTERLLFLRPITFLLALPFLLIGSLANRLHPTGSPEDHLAMIKKWDLVESFPWSWSFFRAMIDARS